MQVHDKEPGCDLTALMRKRPGSGEGVVADSVELVCAGVQVEAVVTQPVVLPVPVFPQQHGDVHGQGPEQAELEQQHPGASPMALPFMIGPPFCHAIVVMLPYSWHT